MAKLIFLPKNSSSNKLKITTQYKSLKIWLTISVVTNISLILTLITTLL